MIILSRLILGMHSVNQVIYGSCLGLIVFSMIFVVFKVNKIPVNDYKKFFREKKFIYIISAVFAVYIGITIANNFIFNRNFDSDKYNAILDIVFEKKVHKYRRFNLDGLFGSFTVFAMLGMHTGQIIFWYLIENKYKYNEIKEMNSIKPIQEPNINNIQFSAEMSDNVAKINNNDNKVDYLNDDSIDDLINHWNMNRVYICDIKNILKIILVIVICALPAVLFIAIPNDANSAIIFIFKIGIPYFVVPFLIYSFGFYYIIKIACGPKEKLMERIKNKKKYGKI